MDSSILELVNKQKAHKLPFESKNVVSTLFNIPKKKRNWRNWFLRSWAYGRQKKRTKRQFKAASKRNLLEFRSCQMKFTRSKSQTKMDTFSSFRGDFFWWWWEGVPWRIFPWRNLSWERRISMKRALDFPALFKKQWEINFLKTIFSTES